MSNNPVDGEALDDLTDELPILLDTAVLDPVEHRVATLVSVDGDETGEHTALFAAPTLGLDDELDTLLADLRAREAKIAALEQDIAQLSTRWQEVERHLNEKDRTIAELTGNIADLRRSIDDQTRIGQGLSTDLIERDGRLDRAQAELDTLRREVAAANSARETAEHALAVTTAEQTTAPARDVDALREELATLTHYIATRRVFWDELENRAAVAGARVKELERELAQREQRQRRAEALAERESARAETTRAALIERGRACEALERELRGRRPTPAAPLGDAGVLRTELDAATALVRQLREQLAVAERQAAAADAVQATREAQHAAELAAARAAVSEALAASPAEDVVRLESELEHRRQELARQRGDLAEQEQRLGALGADLDRTRAELAKTRADLEEKRSDAARLERALVEKDRALEARDQRISTLQNELDEKLGALHRLNALDLSLQGLDSKIAERLARTESTVDGTPSLVCLSGKEPQHYALGKNTMTIGRGSHCDIQILTHFVSREHARLTVSRAGVLIEDLGSTNGVFVNSVRVERQQLRHSDLVTVGETQFRFLETMAH